MVTEDFNPKEGVAKTEAKDPGFQLPPNTVSKPCDLGPPPSVLSYSDVSSPGHSARNF